MYKNSVCKSYLYSCLIENNTAKNGAVFYDASFDSVVYDEDEEEEIFSVINVSNSIFKNNFASDKAPIYYGKSAYLFVNQSIFYNNTNHVIFHGEGNITVLNSLISNYESDFITQFMGGNIVLINNTWGFNDFDFTLSDKTSNDFNLDAIKINDFNISNVQNTVNVPDFDCCSVYLRLNQNDYVISHRRDGGEYNMAVFIDQDKDFIKEFKSLHAYFFLSKVYTNGWVIGCGGWESAGENEKIEAIASDMVKNENINQEALQLILDIKHISAAGHLLIVAPNGTYGNVITYSGNDIIKMGVLGDGDYIVSPNSPDYRVEGHLDNISDVIYANMNLSANDWYGVLRHGIVVHHITLNERGFADAVYVSNDDGKFVNRTDANFCDDFWFKEELIRNIDVPIILDKKYLGTFYLLNKTIISQNASKIYCSDYDYSVQLLNNNGDFLENIAVNITVNGKTNEYITNKKGIVTIPFSDLVTSQIISLTNPFSGEAATNIITVLPTLTSDNLVKYFKNESQFYISLIDSSGNPSAGENITMILNGQSYNRMTNENGTARLNINLNPGEYILTAFDPFTGLMMSYNITVLPVITADDINMTYNDGTQFKAKLIDGKGNPLENVGITFNINGVFYSRYTDSNGTAKLNINLMAGEYIITSQYESAVISNKITITRKEE